MSQEQDQYNNTLKQELDYISKLELAYEQRCTEISMNTENKMKAISPTDLDSQTALLDEQKKLLEEAFKQLKTEINKSSSSTRKQLELLYEEKQKQKLLELEQLIIKIPQK